MSDLLEDRLPSRLSTAKSKEANVALGEIHLTADEPMRPKAVDCESVSEESNPAVFVCPTKVDNDSLRLGFPVHPPALGEWLAPWRGTNPSGVSLLEGLQVADRSLLKFLEGVVVKTCPNALVPAAVEFLDGSLKPCLPGRGEDCNNTQTQTKAHDPANGVGVNVCTLESSVVVELRVGREANSTPSLDKGFQHPVGFDLGLNRPNAGEATVERYAAEYIHQRPILNAEVLDDIELIEFDLVGGEVRQVPSAWRRGTSGAPLPIERSTPFENAPDRAGRRRRLHASCDQFLMDRGGAILAKVAVVFEVLADFQNDILDCVRRAMRALRPRGPVGEIHAVKAPTFGPLRPGQYRGRAHGEPLGHRANRSASTHSAHHLAPLPFDCTFWTRLSP